MEEMPRVQAIVKSARFQEALAVIDAAEVDRPFCKHGLTHLLDVARVAWILSLEQGLGLEREVVYAAALLHDVGRAVQYTTGEPHDEAGERIASSILDSLPEQVTFVEQDRVEILDAVESHRGVSSVGAPASGASGNSGKLAQAIRTADHISRPCFACPASNACNWSDERKNLSLRI